MDHLANLIKVIREKLDELEKEVAIVREENLQLKCPAKTQQQCHLSTDEIKARVRPLRKREIRIILEKLIAEGKIEVPKVQEIPKDERNSKKRRGVKKLIERFDHSITEDFDPDDPEDFDHFKENDVQDQITKVNEKISALKGQNIEEKATKSNEQEVLENCSEESDLQNNNQFLKETESKSESVYYLDSSELHGQDLILDGEKISAQIVVPSIREIAQEDVHKQWKNIHGIAEQSFFLMLKPNERKCQEAKFELMMKELTFQNQMKVLLNHYRKQINLWHLQMQSADTTDFLIFRYVEPIISCSEDFLSDLDECWKSDFMMRGFFKIIEKHAKEKFRVYFDYTVNHQDAVLRINDAKKENGQFKELLQLLENHKSAKNQSLETYCGSPFPRITKMRLILKTISDWMDSDHEEFESCQGALTAVDEVARFCDYAVSVKQLEQKLYFPMYVPKISIVTYGQRLVNEINNLKCFDYNMKKERILRAFLLSDRLILAKVPKKEKDKIKVLEHYKTEDIVPNEIAANKLGINVFSNGSHLNQFVFDLTDRSTYTIWLDHLQNMSKSPGVTKNTQGLAAQIITALPTMFFKPEMGDSVP